MPKGFGGWAKCNVYMEIVAASCHAQTGECKCIGVDDCNYGETTCRTCLRPKRSAQYPRSRPCEISSKVRRLRRLWSYRAGAARENRCCPSSTINCAMPRPNWGARIRVPRDPCARDPRRRRIVRADVMVDVTAGVTAGATAARADPGPIDFDA